MKRGIIILTFLILTAGTLAMEDPIKVKTTPGDEVKIYVWPSDGGQLLNLGKGIANENGTFETTFFSLNVPNVKYQIMIIREGEKIKDTDFENIGIANPLNIDCTKSNCEIVTEEIQIINKTNNTNETNNNPKNITSFEENNSSKINNIYLTGKAMFIKENGSINWYIITGFFALFFFFILVVARRKRKNRNIMDEDEKELECMEEKVKETAKKIQKIKNKKIQKTKIEEAKRKLEEEEQELKKLVEENNNKDEFHIDENK